MMTAASDPRLEQAGKHAEIVHRIYTDRRAGPQARELLLAVAYACGIAPAEKGRGPLNTAARLLGRDAAGRPRFDALVAADAPRYEPPREAASAPRHSASGSISDRWGR